MVQSSSFVGVNLNIQMSMQMTIFISSPENSNLLCMFSRPTIVAQFLNLTCTLFRRNAKVRINPWNLGINMEVETGFH